VSETWACNCIGPQNGQPLCPCQMRGVVERDGRYVRPEQDLGPVPSKMEQELRKIFNDLSSNQEPLGEPFQSIWDASIEDMYEQ